MDASSSAGEITHACVERAPVASPVDSLTRVAMGYRRSRPKMGSSASKPRQAAVMTVAMQVKHRRIAHGTVPLNANPVAHVARVICCRPAH